jgi:hypothetical protein
MGGQAGDKYSSRDSWLVLALTIARANIWGTALCLALCIIFVPPGRPSVFGSLKSLQGHWRSFLGRILEDDKDGGIKHRVSVND